MKEHKAIKKNQQKMPFKNKVAEMKYSTGRLGEKKIQELPEKAEKERYRTQK